MVPRHAATETAYLRPEAVGARRCRAAAQVDVTDGSATGVTFHDGRTLTAQAVVVNADAFKLQQLVGRQHLGPLNAQLDASLIDGCVLKVRDAWSSLNACCVWL